jgi:hypothetical protein
MIKSERITGLFAGGLFLILFSPSLVAQQQTFSRVYYDPAPYKSLQAYSFVRMADRNYMIAGIMNNRAIAIKTDTSGSILWSRQVGNIPSGFFALTATGDSDVVLAGFTSYPASTEKDILCVKMNSAGDTLWTRTIDMDFDDFIYSVKQTKDKGFILAGDGSQQKVVVVKLDSAGNLEWAKFYTGGNQSNYAYGIDQTPDSGYIVTGYMENSPPYEKVMYLLKLSPTGVFSWGKKQVLTGQNHSAGFDVHSVPGGILSYFSATGSGLVLMKMDYSGNFIRSKRYPLTVNNSPGMVPRFHIDTIGGCILAYGDPAGACGFFKTDSMGNVGWHRTLQLNAIDALPCPGGGYLVLGNGPLMGLSPGGTGNPQAGLIQLDSLGIGTACADSTPLTSVSISVSLSNVTFYPVTVMFVTRFPIPLDSTVLSVDTSCVFLIAMTEDQEGETPGISLYPNPSDGAFNLLLSGIEPQELVILDVIDVMGRNVCSVKNLATNPVPVDIGAVLEGIYTVKIMTRNRTFCRKIMISH